MASGAKSFILNRKSDWESGGIIKNLEFENDTLISQNKSGENGVYISGAFDSMQVETVWHRLRLEVNAAPGIIYKLRVYASDTKEILMPDFGTKRQAKVNIDNYILGSEIDINRKIDMFDYIGAKLYENPNDVLLYGFKGRYLWICLEVINYDQGEFNVSSLKIEFPQVSFVDYLPEIYREGQGKDSFLARFVGIFQSIYIDLEDEIDYTPLKFDTDRTSKDFLNWIADWFSVKDASIWGEKRLRQLIKEAVKIYKMKGTKRAIAKIVQEYSGIEPIIVEQFDVKGNMYYDKQKAVVENLFGNNGYVFTVMISEKYIKDTESYVELLRVINEVKPADSICNLVILNDQIYLDYHCYIGINSFITKNEKLVLNRQQRDVNNLMLASSDL